MTHQKGRRWRYNASAVSGYVRKPVGFEDWFYTGPSLVFGHSDCKKSRK